MSARSERRTGRVAHTSERLRGLRRTRLPVFRGRRRRFADIVCTAWRTR